MAHDVFISYASKDKPSADAVCALLEARGIRCWIAPRDIQPGKVWSGAIVEAIEASRAMVVVFTSNVNESDHVPKEVECAFQRGVTVIPLRIEAVRPTKSLDYFLSNVHWLDALTPPLEQHIDELTKTIAKLMPDRAGTGPPIPAPGPPPKNVQAPLAPPAAQPAHGVPKTGGMAKWIPALIALAVVLVGGFWFGTRNSGTNPANPANPATPQNPASVPDPSPRTAPRAATDPIVGCWVWFNNAAVAIHGDGTMTAGPFTARWRVINGAQHKYTFTWPEAVDKVTLSSNGSYLSGGNQYGYTMTATRISPGAGISGTWRWYNNAIVVIGADGTFATGPLSGHWRAVMPDSSYELTWPKPVDSVALSADQQSVSGMNQFGIAISGRKGGSCAF